MEDALVFSGKKYISSKRASEVSGYTKDYIGQLCRGKKIDSRLVGRNWYVSEAALAEHHRESGRRNKKEMQLKRSGAKKRLLEQIDSVKVTTSLSQKARASYEREEAPLIPTITKIDRVRHESRRPVTFKRSAKGKSQRKSRRDQAKVTPYAIATKGLVSMTVVAVLLVIASLFGQSNILYSDTKETAASISIIDLESIAIEERSINTLEYILNRLNDIR